MPKKIGDVVVTVVDNGGSYVALADRMSKEA